MHVVYLWLSMRLIPFLCHPLCLTTWVLRRSPFLSSIGFPWEVRRDECRHSSAVEVHCRWQQQWLPAIPRSGNASGEHPWAETPTRGHMRQQDQGHSQTLAGEETCVCRVMIMIRSVHYWVTKIPTVAMSVLIDESLWNNTFKWQLSFKNLASRLVLVLDRL